MYLFKTSSATFASVIANQKHAFRGAPTEWARGETVLVSKNRTDCAQGEKQIQYIMNIVDVRPLRPGEAERLWPGSEGRWNILVECDRTKRLAVPFDLVEVLGAESRPYKTVMTFRRIEPRHEKRILHFLEGMTRPSQPQAASTVLRDRLRAFSAERDWGKFHKPANVAAALSVEASELLEVFLWKDRGTADELNPAQKRQLQEEIGNVMIYLTILSNAFDLDPIECGLVKLEVNRLKYPVHLSRGRADKYTDL